jgi:uncharacterized protein involved in exopolysaccharide biosynthesis
MTNTPQDKKFEFDAINLIRFTWKNRKILLLISIVAFIASTIIAFSIKPKYKTKIILFPASELSLSKTLVETQIGSNNEKDILTFGNDNEAERLMQVLRSEQLTDHLIEKFDLLKYYSVDLSPKKYPVTTVRGILGDCIKFRRTEYNSIEVEVIDHSPQMAANIANEIANYADTIYYSITNKRAKQAYEIVADEYNSSDQHIRALTDTLDFIRSKGITDFERESEAFSKAYVNALVKNDVSAIHILENKMAVMQKYGGKYDEIHFRLNAEIKRLSHLKGKLAAAKVNYERAFSNVFIVDKAFVPEKKDSPKRIVIILLSTIAAFALSLLALIIQNNIKTSK